MHPVLDRLLAEELVRQRRSDDLYRHVEVFRRAAVDANPHQLEAALFALGRLDEGGALLCDEVGLGKTIEAGIVLTQMRLSGRPHGLILVPLSLAAQWQAELSDLFSLPVTILGADNLKDVSERGLYVIGRELATSPRWVPELKRLGPWDVVVIDEAHEVFSNLHQRFGAKTGAYQSDPTRGGARRAAALLELLGDSPALVLTATPLQNNLYELWSLVHYVDRRGRMLGTLPEFGLLFAKADGRSISEGMEEMLRQRLQGVVQRTLRRQAQPFMERPFTNRRCLTVNFHMDAVTRRLHEALDAWLSGEIHAYPGSQRHLLRLMLRRRMGSSPHALAATLRNVRDRIERMIQNPFLRDPMTVDEDLQALPGEEPLDEPEYRLRLAGLKEDFRHAERLEGLAREVATATFGKAVALQPLIAEIAGGRREGVAPKVVIFTESVRTLEALGAFLRDRGLLVTLLSGGSEIPAETLQRWQDEVGRFLPPQEHPGPSAVGRAALVHEFRTRTQVLLSTEAGAKGLNLQFANCLINFDLPWNPQRVEQRIGRIHRYGQERDVLIINCVNLDNLAEARVYEILHDKLQLFDGLFGASDDILGAVSAALDLERRVNAILDEFRDPLERGVAFDRLALEIDATARSSRDERLARARSLLAKLDAAVAARFRTLAEEMPAAMSRRDEILTRLVGATVVQTQGARVLLELDGRRYHLGPPSPSQEWGEPLSVEHPLVQARVAGLREATDGRTFVHVGPPAAWDVYRVHLSGLETEEVILPVGEGNLQEALEGAGPATVEPWEGADPEGLAEAVEALRLEAEARQRVHLDRRVRALAYRRETQEMAFTLEREDLEARLQAAERRRRSASSLKEQREAGAEVNRVKSLTVEMTADHEAARRAREDDTAAELERLNRLAFVAARVERLFRVEFRGER